MNNPKNIALEVTFHKFGNFGASVGSHFIQSVDTDINRATIDQI
jgi:hypothetical protein